MKRAYLGLCPDVKSKGRWIMTKSTPEGDYNTKAGSLWRGVQVRVKNRSESNAYTECQNNFEGFQEFVDWCHSQTGYFEGWHLDKDLFGKGRAIYSPETCCFLPASLNVLMQGIGSWQRGELVGASFYKRDGCWRAYANDSSGQLHLGYFASQEKAHGAWRQKKAEQIKEELIRWELPHREKAAIVDLIKTLKEDV